MPVDYSKGKIYKIVDLDTDECYIGSTCEPTLARRLAGHLYNYKKYLKGTNRYCSSFKIIKDDNYKIELIEKYPCKDKDELRAREAHHIRTEVLKRMAKVHKCECGANYTFCHRKRHERTIKHHKWLESQGEQ